MSFSWDVVSTIVTVIGFIILYVHQNNKIKYLEDVINKQKTGIDSQSIVLQNALEYAEKFDAKKIEGLLRLTLDKEKEDDIQKIVTEYEYKLYEVKENSVPKEEVNKLLQSLKDEIVKLATDSVTDILYEPFIFFVVKILTLEENEQEKIINNLKSERTKKIILGIKAYAEEKWGKENLIIGLERINNEQFKAYLG